MNKLLSLAALLSLSAGPALAQTPATDRPSWAKPAASSAAAKAVETKEPEPEPTGIRDVTASRELITLTTKLRYTTMILLPDEDEVLDIVSGDAAMWVINATKNIVHVKPTKAGAETNLNLVMASGAVYSFIVREGGKAPDLKVYIAPDQTATPMRRKYYTAVEYDAIQAQLIEAKAGMDAERQRAEEQIAAAKREVPGNLICDYGQVPNVKPFFVQSICRTSEFTYIRSAARELPALYELKDGQASVLQYQVVNGLYVVPKVLEKAYLAIGRERLPFELRSKDGN